MQEITTREIEAIEKGDKVTVSYHPGATWFKVLNIGKFTAEIQEKELYRSQFIDKFIICKINKECVI